MSMPGPETMGEMSWRDAWQRRSVHAFPLSRAMRRGAWRGLAGENPSMTTNEGCACSWQLPHGQARHHSESHTERSQRVPGGPAPTASLRHTHTHRDMGGNDAILSRPAPRPHSQLSSNRPWDDRLGPNVSPQRCAHSPAGVPNRRSAETIISGVPQHELDLARPRPSGPRDGAIVDPCNARRGKALSRSCVAMALTEDCGPTSESGQGMR